MLVVYLSTFPGFPTEVAQIFKETPTHHCRRLWTVVVYCCYVQLGDSRGCDCRFTCQGGVVVVL